MTGLAAPQSPEWEWTAVVDAVRGLVSSRRVLYVCTPINGGRRLLAAARNGDVRHDRVIAENKAAGQQLAEALRDRTGQPVFDPTTFRDGVGWGQDDYRRACLSVLTACAGTVVLADGWQFSVGCVAEVAAAAELGLDIVDSELRPYTTLELSAAIHEGQATLAELHYLKDGAVWDRALRALDRGERRSAGHAPDSVTAAKTA